MSSSIQLPLDNETAVVPDHPKHDAFDSSNQNHVHPPNEGVVTMTIQEYERLLLLSRTAATSSSAGTSTTASTTTKDDDHTAKTWMRPPLQAPSLPQLIDDNVSDDDAARESNEQEQAAPPPTAAAAAAAPVDSGRPTNKKPSLSRWTRVVRWCSSRAKKRANRRRDRRRQQEPTPDNDPPRGDKQDASEKVEAAVNEAIVDDSLPMSKTKTEEEEEKEELVVGTTHTSNSDVETLVRRRMNDQVIDLDGAKLDKAEHDLVVDGESSSLVHQSKSADNNDDKEDQTVCTSLFCDSVDNVLQNENGSLDDREVDKQAVEQVSCQPSVDSLPQNRERELNDDLLDEEELAAVSPAKIEDYLGDAVQTEDGANGNEDNKQKVLVSTSSQHTVDEHELQTRENKHDDKGDENSAREQDDMHVVQNEGYKRDHNNDEVGLASTARRQGHSMDDGAQKEELMLDGQDDTELAVDPLAREHLVDDTLQDQDGKHGREEDEQEQAVVLAFHQHGTEDVRQTQERKHDHDKQEHVELQAEESNHDHDKDEQAVGPVAQMHNADDDEEGNEGDDQYPVLPARRHSMGNLLEARECKQDHGEDGKAAIPASGHHSVGDLMQRNEHEAVETPTRRSVSELLRNYERKSIVAPRARFKCKEPETPQPTSKSDVRNNLQSGVVRPRAGRIGSQKFNLS